MASLQQSPLGRAKGNVHQDQTKANADLVAGGHTVSSIGSNRKGETIRDQKRSKTNQGGGQNPPALISISSSPAHSPHVVAAPLKPVQSIPLELDDLGTSEPLWNDKGILSLTSGPRDDGESLNRTSSHRVRMRDDDQEITFKKRTVSEYDEEVDFSDDLAASTRGIKSPYLGTKGEASQGYGKSRDPHKDLEEGDPIMDSPTLGTGYAAHKLRSPGPRRPVDNSSPTSPNPTVNTIATASTSTRAERNLQVPFLPQNLRLRGNDEEMMSEETIKQDGKPGPQEAISFFEDDSSSEEFPTKATVHKAKQRRFTRPTLVKHGSGSVVLGLKEMLRTTGPTSAEKASGSSKRKLAKLTGEGIWSSKLVNDKRAGIVGLPTDEAGNSHTPDSQAKNSAEQPVHLGNRQNSVRNFTDGLRSHPVRRSATVPAGRKVTFPSPPELDIQPEHRLLRQTTVSTPYPMRQTPTVEEISGRNKNDKREAFLKLVLYNSQTRSPLTKQLVIPCGRGIRLEDSSDERKPKMIATLRIEFDDEKLAKLIRQEYIGIRGIIRSTFSARNLQDIRLVSYDTISDLVHQMDSNSGGSFAMLDDHDLSEAQLLALYRKPRLGRRKHAWVEWIERLPENVESPRSRKEKVALQLVEGWCIWKIVTTLLVVLALSIAATLLWIFLGIGGDSSRTSPTSFLGLSIEAQNNNSGFLGAGGRLQTGVLMGSLVLMLGWTGTGAWILLSWLT